MLAPPSATARSIVLASTSTTSVTPRMIATALSPRPTSSAPSTDTPSPRSQPPTRANSVGTSKLSSLAATVILLSIPHTALAKISSGYSKLDESKCKPAGPVAGFNAPKDLDAAINAPLIQKDGKDYDTYNGMRLFNTNPYDPSLCAAACDAQTEFDSKHIVDKDGNYKPCNFFTSYVLTKNGVPLGTYCALYTQEWTEEYAVNTGYYYGDDVYKVVCAAGYTASDIDDGNIN